MKVLYISSGQGEDYQCDVLFHGLRELYGENAVDVNRISSLYKQSDESKHAMYGRGYTVYANLPDIEIDRDSIPEKIQSAYFDLIIYGSIHRCNSYLSDVLKIYPPSRVLFIDGEDWTRVKWHLLGKGIYFKRELVLPMQPYLHPIYFAVPAEKFLTDHAFEQSLLNKKYVFAPCDPRDRSTYKFHTEPAYYQQYRESYFGVTMKKAGWDCMRHHEIASQGTAPYFLGLDDCPDWTMHRLPRLLLCELSQLVNLDERMESSEVRARYCGLMRTLFEHYKRDFTTVALAEYVLGVVANLGEVDQLRKRSWILQAQRLYNRYKVGAESLFAR